VPTQFSGFETLATLLPAEKLLIKLENAYDLRKSGLATALPVAGPWQY
jgi:hypothetical protein